MSLVLDFYEEGSPLHTPNLLINFLIFLVVCLPSDSHFSIDSGELDWEKSMGTKEGGIFLSHTPIREMGTLTWQVCLPCGLQVFRQVSWAEA